MERLTDISVIRDILSRHGFTFSKALGQNFLINPSVCPRMAESAVEGEHTGVLEIGPGIGVLTRELLERAEKVVAVELDRRLLPVLDETLAEYDNLRVVNADVLELDLNKLIAGEFDGMDVAVCANLPYYITSPVIMKLLEDHLPVRTITVMVQKEAAVRLCAEPGTRDSSAITAAVRYYCTPELLFHVSSGSFMPAPRVDSAVIQLRLHEPQVHPKDEKTFFKVIRAAFAQRRKTVLNSLSSSLSLDKTAVRAILESAGVDATARAERLTLGDFAAIADAVYEKE
ncbi:16S rRNA (adenine(1518)-N(6)/adenine(1519)-N(6))-dimethyltransferase RsmA [uncultured Ruminococcus sp.]|uniref:16S rRNA (adenine(1518)-N(6)/adenine(1519)-N(6))- dimethyltransferase RsmA n=1 Tax=uncultured Ruminococcus sp. TaxID=165186 RepID=UPI0029317D1A|nr:16S rRNA (adenine(1518)-N(6)/adenine(1519)-N(6))-dimethyltransferase RsmA [uncultured Ruminococcus sp.]